MSERRSNPGEALGGKVVPIDGRRPTSTLGLPRQTIPPRHDEDGAGGRLALLELLIGCADPIACAQRAVDWLGERAGVDQVLCALVDAARGQLVGVAGWGLPPAAVSEVALDLARGDHPILAALGAGMPQLVRADHDDPLGPAAFMAYPLHGCGPRGDVRAGVLLTTPMGAEAARDVRWLVGVLSPKLVGLVASPPDATSAASVESRVREATAELARQSELVRRQRLELEQAAAQKAQFLAGMSHQLRTPLNAVLGYTSMLLQGLGGELPERPRGMLARVDTNARSLLCTINDVLDISRIEADRMPISVSEFTVEDVLAGALDEHGPVIARSGLEVRAEIAPLLPTLRTDRAKVKQILLNLLANALKYTREGSVTLRATFDRREKVVSLAVIDTGIGIPEPQQRHLFEDFQQVDNPVNRQQGGAGLGLAICQRLAALLGGRIVVVSAPSAGSTFTLLLRPEFTAPT